MGSELATFPPCGACSGSVLPPLPIAPTFLSCASLSPSLSLPPTYYLLGNRKKRGIDDEAAAACNQRGRERIKAAQRRLGRKREENRELAACAASNVQFPSERPPEGRVGPRGLVNKNRTSLRYDSEALNEVLFSFLFTNLENSTSFRASESYFNEVPFLFTSPLQL